MLLFSGQEEATRGRELNYNTCQLKEVVIKVTNTGRIWTTKLATNYQGKWLLIEKIVAGVYHWGNSIWNKNQKCNVWMQVEKLEKRSQKLVSSFLEILSFGTSDKDFVFFRKKCCNHKKHLLWNLLSCSFFCGRAAQLNSQYTSLSSASR